MIHDFVDDDVLFAADRRDRPKKSKRQPTTVDGETPTRAVLHMLPMVALGDYERNSSMM